MSVVIPNWVMSEWPTIRSELRNHRLVGGMSASRHWRPAIYEAGSPRENSALNDRSGSASFWWLHDLFIDAL